MTRTNEISDAAAQVPVHAPALAVGKKLAIWCLFLAAVYLARDFFFTAFMTFLFCYLALGIVDWAMSRLSPRAERAWLRRLLTIGLFLFLPLVLLGVGALLGPQLLDQVQRFAGWLSHVNPEGEVATLAEQFVGPAEFQQQYGGPDDPRYQAALDDFRKSGASHVAAYEAFPKQEAWVEAGFSKRFDERTRTQIRARLDKEKTSSKSFEDWFRTRKFPELQQQARTLLRDKDQHAVVIPPLVRDADATTPDQLLATVRHDPTELAGLRKEWLRDTTDQELLVTKRSPAYLDQFRTYYNARRARTLQTLPYTFDEYQKLQTARTQGPRAFGEAIEQLNPTPAADREARLQKDFETAKRHELFQAWWADRQVLRHQLETLGSGSIQVESLLSFLVDVPVALGTALLLSLFICIDFQNLKRGVQGVRDTWLRDVYDEIAPALRDLARLVGLSMQAQGLIALCNAGLMFIALSILGVEHAVFLSGAVFVLCLVPTLGMLLAWVLVAVVALVQPGGGVSLAVQASVAVVVVIMLEVFVLSPRILGQMMELHPVLIMAILPVAQYFFGIWGLILATPVAVYVIYEIILNEGLPGSRPAHAAEEIASTAESTKELV